MFVVLEILVGVDNTSRQYITEFYTLKLRKKKQTKLFLFHIDISVISAMFVCVKQKQLTLLMMFSFTEIRAC